MTRLADWLPEPLTVPTRIARSLTVGALGRLPGACRCFFDRGKRGWHVVLSRGRQRPHAPQRRTHLAHAMGSRRASHHNNLEDLGRECRSLPFSPSHSTGFARVHRS